MFGDDVGVSGLGHQVVVVEGKGSAYFHLLRVQPLEQPHDVVLDLLPQRRHLDEQFGVETHRVQDPLVKSIEKGERTATRYLHLQVDQIVVVEEAIDSGRDYRDKQLSRL